MKQLYTHCRTAIYMLSFFLVGAVQATSSGTLFSNHETVWYGVIALLYLYLTLLPGALYSVFPKLPFKKTAIRSRRAFGFGTFFFSAIHGYFGFFKFVGGFWGLQFWSRQYALSLFLGSLALAILGVLAFTSIPFIMKSLGTRWQSIHRLIYVAALLSLVHGVTITVHMFNLTPILVVTYIAILFLVALEIMRLNNYIHTRFVFIPRHGFAYVALPFAATILFWSFFFVNHHIH